MHNSIILNIFQLFRPELLSDSEFEDNPNSTVIVPQKLVSRGNIVGTQSSIRLSELGPRLTLQVTNISLKFLILIACCATNVFKCL